MAPGRRPSPSGASLTSDCKYVNPDTIAQDELADPMTLEEALRTLAPFAEPQGFNVEAACRRFASDELRAVPLRPLGEGLEAGRVTSSAWRSATASDVPGDFVVAFGQLWGALVGAGLVDSAAGFPHDWSQETLRLWAYTDGWSMTEQDEDLVLLSDEYAAGLFDIARDRACPKRDYILDSLQGWAQRQALGAARGDAFSERMAYLALHASLAHAAGAAALADYLSRLGTYGVLGPVDREGAHQRGLDLCAGMSARSDDVTVERDGPIWRVHLRDRTRQLRVAADDGRIW